MDSFQAARKYARASDNVLLYGIFDQTPLASPDFRKRTSGTLCAVVQNTEENIKKVKNVWRAVGVKKFHIYGRGPYVKTNNDYPWTPDYDRAPTKDCPYVAIYRC